MSGYWWRAYDEAVDDPKLQMLPAPLFRVWFNLCCLTSANGGILPSIDVIAFKLHMSPAKVKKLIEELRNAILIDDDQDGMRPHNWNGRQYKSDVTDPTNAERQQRYRDKKRVTANTVTPTVTPTGTVTPPRVQSTEAETETDTERKKDAAGAASSSPATRERELFERGKEVLGQNAGGLIKKLVASKGSTELARAAIETAATKQNPREYIAGSLRDNRGLPPGQLWDPGL